MNQMRELRISQTRWKNWPRIRFDLKELNAIDF